MKEGCSMAYSPESQKKYNDKNFTFMTIKLHNEKDADILEYINSFIESGSNRQSAIKQIIRNQIKELH